MEDEIGSGRVTCSKHSNLAVSPRRALWERSTRPHPLPMFLPRSFRPSPCFHDIPYPSPFLLTGQWVWSSLAAPWRRSMSGVLRCVQDGAGADLKDQSFPSPAFPTGPAAGCPVAHSKACSDREPWKKKDAVRKERLGH